MATKQKIKKAPSHCVIRNGNLFCSHCGATQLIPYPIAVTIYGAMIDAFEKVHKNCKQTWKEAEPDLSQSIGTRLQIWLKDGEHGSSADTMFSVMAFGSRVQITGISSVLKTEGEYSHPFDADDLKRCIKFLQWVPEWKKDRLFMMKSVSKVWSNLVENWDKMTEMYEQEKYKELSQLMEELRKA